MLRSAANPTQKKVSIEKVQLTEFVSLPGVLSDRLYAIMSADSSDGRITTDRFFKIMSTIYCSDLIQKMGLVFCLYDFDNDGYIQREDVKLLLSYIPLRTQEMKISSNSLNGSSSLSQDEAQGNFSQNKKSKPQSRKRNQSPKEGLYSPEDGKDLDVQDRAEM